MVKMHVRLERISQLQFFLCYEIAYSGIFSVITHACIYDGCFLCFLVPNQIGVFANGIECECFS